MTVEYEIRIHALLVAPKGRGMLDDCATEVRISDEGAGEFVVVSQLMNAEKGISISPNEWPTVRAAIDRQIQECRK